MKVKYLSLIRIREVKKLSFIRIRRKNRTKEPPSGILRLHPRGYINEERLSGGLIAVGSYTAVERLSHSLVSCLQSVAHRGWIDNSCIS